MKSASGLSLLLRNRAELGIYRHIFVQRVYPLETIVSRLGSVPFPVVFDVGANNGQFAAAAFDHWPQAQVHCFEPQPELIHRIREFASINDVADRMFINHCAVSSEPGEADFFQNRSPISASLIREKVARRTIRRTLRVPVTTLDTYARSRGIHEVHVLKIDVEGSEIDVLKGGTGLLSTVSVIFLEVHPPFCTFRQAVEFLASQGLACVSPTIDPGNSIQADCVFVRPG
jgi:FkbM family methyltransferase